LLTSSRLRAREARDRRRDVEGLHEGGPDELFEVLHGVRRERHELERRQPLENRHEQVEHQHAREEDRHAEAADREDADHVVGPAVLAHRGDDAERHRPEHREEDREHRQLDRARHALLQDVGDGPLLRVGLAEVAARRVPEPVEILDDDGLVEPELLADLPDLFLLDRARLAAGLVDEDLGDVPGNEPHQHEDEDGRAQQRRDEQEQAPRDVPTGHDGSDHPADDDLGALHGALSSNARRAPSTE